MSIVQQTCTHSLEIGGSDTHILLRFKKGPSDRNDDVLLTIPLGKVVSCPFISKALPGTSQKKVPFNSMINLSNMIAAILILFLSSFLFFPFPRFELVDFVAGSAAGSCSLDTINIGTQRSGREIGGKPEWNVQVINNCNCPQKQIVLSCPEFQTVEPVSPSILSKKGDTCLLKNGDSVPPGGSVSFSYTWDPPFIMFPRHSVPQCPALQHCKLQLPFQFVLSHVEWKCTNSLTPIRRRRQTKEPRESKQSFIAGNSNTK